MHKLHTTVFKFIRDTKDKAKNIICLEHALICNELFVVVYDVFSTLKSTKFISFHIDIASYV